MEFKIRDDIEIRSISFKTNETATYTSTDTARLVSYFLNKINNITDLSKPIGVKLGLLNIVSTCCMLALIKSGRDYGLIYYQPGLDIDVSHFSHVFNLGPYHEIANNFDELLEFETQGLAHEITTDLNFKFSETQRVYFLATESDQLGILTNTGKIEASAVKAAMDNYFDENDYCIFNRPMRHVGVATLCIYPALFKAKGIVFCSSQHEWNNQIHLANHVHMSYEMMFYKWPLPSNLRMLTTGGYDFNDEFIAHVHSVCNVENIVDCYGTRYCPPPMAIRHLKLSNYPIPFTWINEVIKPNFRDNWLHLTSTEDVFKDIFFTKSDEPVNEYKTLDSVFAIDDVTFYLVDKKDADVTTDSFIRMNHETYSDSEFMDYVYKNTDISVKLAYHYDGRAHTPKILVNPDELDKAVKFVKENEVEAALYVKHND